MPEARIAPTRGLAGAFPARPPPNRPPIKGRKAGVKPALQKLPLGIEPKTSSLPMKCSTPELRQRASTHSPYRPNPTRQPFPRTSPFGSPQERETGFEPATACLEGKYSTVELLPHTRFPSVDFELPILNPTLKPVFVALQSSIQNRHSETDWVERESNPRTRERPDLQSGAFDRSAIYPLNSSRQLPQSPRRDLNPRPTVYKTVALPLSYAGRPSGASPGTLTLSPAGDSFKSKSPRCVGMDRLSAARVRALPLHDPAGGAADVVAVELHNKVVANRLGARRLALGDVGAVSEALAVVLRDHLADAVLLLRLALR